MIKNYMFRPIPAIIRFSSLSGENLMTAGTGRNMSFFNHPLINIIRYTCCVIDLTLNPLTWKMWWAPNNAIRWQTGFNSAFKGLIPPPINLYTQRGWHISEFQKYFSTSRFPAMRRVNMYSGSYTSATYFSFQKWCTARGLGKICSFY